MYSYDTYNTLGMVNGTVMSDCKPTSNNWYIALGHQTIVYPSQLHAQYAIDSGKVDPKQIWFQGKAELTF